MEGAAPASLTSSLEFNLKLIKLYEQHECLWNMNDANFLNAKLLCNTWSHIASELDGTHQVTVEFCRNRIRQLRHCDNRYQLRKMRGKPKGGPYFVLLSECKKRFGATHMVNLNVDAEDRDVQMSLTDDQELHLDILLPTDFYADRFAFLNKIFTQSQF